MKGNENQAKSEKIVSSIAENAQINLDKRSRSWISVSAIMILLIAGLIGWQLSNSNDPPNNIPSSLQSQFSTDFSKSTLTDFSLVVSGGPPKDGIPALNNLEFESLSETNVAETTRGVLVELNGEKRFYPYNILVWHEIANDQIGDTPISVTFCPLCGSAIVYERNFEGQELEFGVSGFLRESNMIMFDRETETLWQQSTGEAIAGEHSGKKLTRVPLQLIELFTVREQHPDAVIMTDNTGHSRDYTVYPYGNYDNSEDLFFEVTVDDNRFPTKELFYAVESGNKSIALRIGELENDSTVSFDKEGIKLTAEKKDGEIFVREEGSDEPLAGYYEMWFSWATWHRDSGLVWEPSQSNSQ